MPKALPANTHAVNLFPRESDEDKQERLDNKSVVVDGIGVWERIQTLAPKSRQPLGSEVVEFDQASYIIEQARMEAEGMILRAEMEVEYLIEDAKETCLNLKSTAATQGFNDGVARARSEVESELNTQFETRCQELNHNVDALVNTIVSEREIMWKAMEDEVLRLSLEIAKKVTKIEIDGNQEVVMSVIKDALRRASDRTNLRILVNPNELMGVRANRDDLLIALDGIKNLEIDPDRRIGPGGCVIETNAGSIDAKIETQFDQVESTLLT